MKITGFHSIEEAIKSGRKGDLFLSAKNPRTLKLEEIAKRSHVKVRWISPREMTQLAGSPDEKACFQAIRPTIRKAAASGASLSEHISSWGERDDVLVLLLDGITDMHNLGAILRTCDKFEVDLVISPKHNNAPMGEGAYRTSSGASEYVPQYTATNLRQAIEELQKSGFWVYTADLAGEPLDQAKLNEGRLALVMGSEDKGPKSLTSKIADGSLTIPCGGHVDSLNVGVATGILLYEVRRQQKFFR